MPFKRLGHMVESDATGVPYLSMTTGWLGDVKRADYATAIQRASWAHGFAHGYMDDGGVLYLSPTPIIFGRCCIGDKIIRG